MILYNYAKRCCHRISYGGSSNFIQRGFARIFLTVRTWKYRAEAELVIYALILAVGVLLFKLWR